MPNLLIQSKHEEFKSNSALQIINHKERRSRRRARKQKSIRMQKFCTTKILHSAKFSPNAKISPYICDFLIRLTSFFPFYPSCIIVIKGIFIFLLT